jgi:phosphoglycerate dehydrogenase-like enzyme
MIKAAFFNNDTDQHHDHVIDNVYRNGRKEKIAQITDLYPEIITTENFDQQVENLQDIEVVFSTWGMLPLTAEQIKRLPSLKIVFFAAGATNTWRDPFLENGVRICSANVANAMPVAEFTMAQILLSCKWYFQNTMRFINKEFYENAKNIAVGPGVYDRTISIIGNGNISNYLQDLLKNFKLNVIVVPSRIEKRTVSLEDAFKKSQVVVNLLPDRDDNVGVLHGKLFESMPDKATFINVGRGRQVNEQDLITVLKRRDDLTALLDVQFPEPPENDSELYRMNNIQLSTHMAGSINDELTRMADFMIEDFLRYEKGDYLHYEVDVSKL